AFQRVWSNHQLVWIGATRVADCNRFSTPNQLRATLSKAVPAAERAVGWLAIGGAVPSFHWLNRDAIANRDSGTSQRLDQRRIYAGEWLLVTWNVHAEEPQMLPKALGIVHSCDTWNRGHEAIDLPGNRVATAAPSSAIAMSTT